MAYQISDVRRAVPQAGGKYFFDANVWLAVLDLNFQTRYSPAYVNFFDDIHSRHTVANATIVMPALLLSEVLNRLMNDIYYSEFERRNPKPADQSKGNHYKKIYRPSPDFESDFKMACASIRSYHQNVTFVSDNLDGFSFKELTKNIPTHLDFNDHLYCKLAKKQGWIIVTGDSDFRVEDIPIITSHPTLLAL